MKRFPLLFILLVFTAKSFSQTGQDFTPSKEYYLQKSKKEKKSAFILLGIGVATTTAGLLVHANNKDYYWAYSKHKEGAVTAVVGITLTALSVPIFIKSANHRKKALEFDSNPNQIPGMANQHSSLDTVVRTREYYLERSKKDRKIAWILLGAGITSLTIGALLMEKEDPNHEGFSPGRTLGTAGGAMLWVSLPFFIEAGKHRKKAATLALESHPLQIPGLGNNSSLTQAAISIKFGL